MEDIVAVLKETPLKKIRPIVVGDRAMLNDKIIVEYHKRDDMDYLGAIQLTKKMKKKIADISDEEYKIINTDRDYGLYSGYLTTWDFSHNGESYEDRILIVRSEQKALTDEKSRNKKIKKAKCNLDDLQLKINKTIYKKIDKVKAHVASIIKDAKADKYFDVAVQITDDEQISLDYILDQNVIDEDMKLDGKYILATNRMDLSAKRILNIYKKRDISEKDFEILKSTLNLRPIFLRKDKRIKALIFFTMCSLLIYNIIKLLIKNAEIEQSVKKVLKEFEGVSASCCIFIDGSVSKVIYDLDKTQSEIYEKLNLGYLTEHVKFNY